MSYYSAVPETFPSTAEPSALAPAPPVRRPFWRRLDVLGAAIALAVLIAFALTVDAVNNGYGLKSDEATYTAAAFSIAYDHDLVFERKDLQRYWAIYTCGPDGIFLQKPRGFYRLSARFPFVRFVTWNDPPGDRLYFGKAFIYPLLAAPLVWLFGLNGMLVFNILLLAGAVWCGYVFLVARSATKPAAMAYTLAFVGISIVPVYVVWYMPEVFNLALLFYAYFFWLYKEVAAAPVDPPANRAGAAFTRFLYGPGSDLAAALLLGVLVFSKPLYILLPAPLFAWLVLKGRFKRAAMAVVVFGVVAGSLFAANAAVSGEVSYQGGNRKQFYPNRMVFQNPESTFESVGFSNATNKLHPAIFDSRAFVYRLCLNTGYFLFGRHSGLMPYFFPGFLALLLWVARWKWIRGWQVLTFLAVLGSVAVTLVILPYTWAGGGGPPGNRYFMGIYPALFFLLPPVESLLVPLVAWVGGAVFTAQLVLNPYFTARFFYWNVDHGAVRALPIELTMVNDLPIMLDVSRAPIKYEGDPQLLLYLLDRNAFAPEPAGLWVKGGRRADIVVRTTRPLTEMRVNVSSPIANRVRLSFDGRSTSVELKAGQPVDVVIPTGEGVYADNGYSYVLSVTPAEGVVPLLEERGSKDKRFLGALLQLKGTLRP